MLRARPGLRACQLDCPRVEGDGSTVQAFFTAACRYTCGRPSRLWYSEPSVTSLSGNYTYHQYAQFDCMEQRSCWEADSSSASREIPHVLRNPKVITVFTTARHWARWIQSALITCFFIRHFSIILPSMIGSPKWSLSFMFPHRTPACTSPPVCHMSRCVIVLRQIALTVPWSSSACSLLQSPVTQSQH